MSLNLWSQEKKNEKNYTRSSFEVTIVRVPEPPALGIQYNEVDDNPYDGILTYSKSDVENNETLQENIPSTSSVLSTITSFKINNIISGKL